MEWHRGIEPWSRERYFAPEHAEYEHKMQARADWKEVTGGKLGGKPPTPPGPGSTDRVRPMRPRASCRRLAKPWIERCRQAFTSVKNSA